MSSSGGDWACDHKNQAVSVWACREGEDSSMKGCTRLVEDLGGSHWQANEDIAQLFVSRPCWPKTHPTGCIGPCQVEE